MKPIVKKRNGWPTALIVLLLVSAVANFSLFTYHFSLKDRIRELESQLGKLRKQEEQSAVDRRVSRQMEEIARGQQVLSEERSREAIRQSEIAQKMTLRSEAERQNALRAQAAAEASAAEALASYQLAEHQRQVAEDARQVAEHARQVADTLNHISLGRTLGSQSYAIYRSGDTELGTMLAYAAYLYTNDNGGNLYTSSVYQALTQAARSKRSWSIHNGRITGVDISNQDGSLMTVSTCGELLLHRHEGNRMKTKHLFDDRNFCFRDVFSANIGKSYAVSHTGHLVVVDGDQTRVVFLENVGRPFSLQPMPERRLLLIVGENSVAMYDMAVDKVIGTRHLDFTVVSTGRHQDRPLLFDNRGRMHTVGSLSNISSEKVPVSGQVTAFVSGSSMKAYGMADGSIWLTYPDGKVRKLAGHLSKVTRLKMIDNRLYSSSYDGKMLFWMTSDLQIQPITLFQADNWLTDFTFTDDKDYIWTGDNKGNVSEHLISLPVIAEHIRQGVKRNFTQEEWDFYVGKGIPYRKLRIEN